MKRLSMTLCLILALIYGIPAFAGAETQQEFELQCYRKTAADADVYNNSNLDHVLIDHIPAGTYVIVNTGSQGNWKKITYMIDGVKKSGYTEVSLADAASVVRRSDGMADLVHENDPDYEKKIAEGTVEYDVKAALDRSEVPASAPTPAPMPESITDHSIGDAYGDSAFLKDPDRSVIYYQYAYNPAGHVDLLRYGFDGVTGTLENGSKVAVTNMQEKGYTYIQFGSTYGWVKNSDLVSKLPEGTAEKDQKNVSYRYLVGDYMAPVPLYANPGDAEDIGSLTAGAGILVAVHEWRDGYGYITFGGWKGWVKAKYLSGASSYGSSSAVAAAPASTAAPVQEAATAVPAPRQSSSGMANRTAPDRTEPTAAPLHIAGAPQDQRLAVIFAPNTGHAALRKGPKESAKLLKNCKAGVIVQVLEAGEVYAKVDYKGTAGYVKNTSMQFFAPTEAQGTGLLSYRGKTNGSTTVNVRCKADKNSWIVAQWETGTEVTVLSFADGWYEIEAHGIHGYVLAQYLTVQ